MFSMTVTGIPEALLKLDLFERLLIKELIGSIDWSTITVRDFARTHHPYVDRTGNLTHSINMEPAKVEGQFVAGKVFAGMAYAVPVEFGTSKSRPYPFMLPALRQNQKKIEQAMEGAVKRSIMVVQGIG